MPVASVVDKGSHRLSCEWIGLGLAVLTVVATFVAGGFSFFGYSPGAYVLLLGGSFGCWWLWRFAEQRVKESVIKLLVAYGIFVTWLATVKEPAYPAKRVVSIEPDSTCFAALRARYGRDKGTFLKNIALGNRAGVGTFFVEEDGSAYNTLSEKERDWVASTHKRNLRKVSVPVSTLDNMIAKYGIPDFLKIDVKGGELSLFDGLSTLCLLFYIYGKFPSLLWLAGLFVENE